MEINIKVSILGGGEEVKVKGDIEIKIIVQLTTLKDLWINTSLTIQFRLGAGAALRARDEMNHPIKDKKAMVIFWATNLQIG